MLKTLALIAMLSTPTPQLNQPVEATIGFVYMYCGTMKAIVKVDTSGHFTAWKVTEPKEVDIASVVGENIPVYKVYIDIILEERCV